MDNWTRVSDELPPRYQFVETYHAAESNGGRATNICACYYHPGRMTEPEWCEQRPPFGGGRTTTTHSTFLAPTHWRPRRVRDEGVELAKEAAITFGNYTAPAPGVLPLSDGDRQLLEQYCWVLEALAERMKEKAQEANALGRTNLGILLIRAQLSVEETGEWLEAMKDGDIVAAFKELTDMQVVTDGHYVTLGLQDVKLAGLNAVYRANKTKLGSDGKPIISEAGRHVKGPNYQAPDMARVLKEAEENRP